jgi:hypothetical protein
MVSFHVCSGIGYDRVAVVVKLPAWLAVIGNTEASKIANSRT